MLTYCADVVVGWVCAVWPKRFIPLLEWYYLTNHVTSPGRH